MSVRYDSKHISQLVRRQDAKKRVTAVLRGQIYDDTEALATHWLQNPEAFAPHLTRFLAKKCLMVLNAYCEESVAFPLFVSEKLSFSQQLLPIDWSDVSYPPPRVWSLTFIDLFAGIGGFHIAMHQNGGKCVFASEWDKYARQTYETNFGQIPFGDITQIDARLIPDHDVLCAGFPCQPFSLAGVSKKNSLGRKHGFADKTQGTLFFDVCRIIKIKRPKAFFLENVKNLVSHDNGKTFSIIQDALDELGYVWTWQIVNGSAWVPQHRERIFMVGYDPEQVPRIQKKEIIIPLKPDHDYPAPQLRNIIHPILDDNTYTLGKGTWDTLQRHKIHHEKAGNGFGYGLHKLPIPPNAITRTISARYHKDGAEILIEQKGKNPRRLTIEEAMQLQGYNPLVYQFPVSRTQAYHQIGNSVVVPAISATVREMVTLLKNKGVLS